MGITDTATTALSSFLGHAWIGTGTFILLLILLVLATLLSLIIWSGKKYPLKVIVYEQRGDTVVINTKRKLGRHTMWDQREVWMFKQGPFGILRRGDTIPPEHYQYVARSFEATGVVTLLQYGKGQYKVLDPRPLLSTGNFEVIDVDDMNWKIQEQRATLVRRQDSKERWAMIAPYAAIIVGLIFVAGTTYMCFNLIRDVQDKNFAIQEKQNLYMQKLLGVAETIPPAPPPLAPNPSDFLKPSG